VRPTFTRRGLLRPLLAAAAFAFISLGLQGCGGGGGDAPTIPAGGGGAVVTPQSTFAASWTTALFDGTAPLAGRAPFTAESFDNQSVRQVVRLSVGGDALRVKISNLFGKTPVTFSGVHLAKAGATASTIDAATDVALTFGGQSSITLAAGAESTSDAVTMTVAPLTTMAVTMYFAGATPMPTVHWVARHTTYVAPGNRLSAPSMLAISQDLRASYYGLAAVEASSTLPAKVIVAFGDSHTDGLGSTFDANKRYPDQLDDRVKTAGQSRTAIVNAGISGNRWVNDFTGPSGNSRFDRDVLGVTGVTGVILLEGINDIGFPVSVAPGQDVSAQQIIDSIAGAAAKARARGVKVFVGTLLPFKGSDNYNAEGEAKRQAVNAWIRSSTVIDAVFDFDSAVRNPADTASLLPAFDSGDHLHPNDAGYAAMASAVDVTKF
jgi:lysophospholipase L1-like esterase